MARGGGGQRRLEEIVAQLEGLPLSYTELEGVILPSRIRGFRPQMLDELGAMGWLVWVGAGSLGARDGKVALYRRERVEQLLDPPEPPEELDDHHRAIIEHLENRGASFFIEVQNACGAGTRVREVAEALWDLVW